MMAANPVRPAVLLKEIRDLFVDLTSGDEANEDMMVQFFGMLLKIDTLAGDTRTKDKLREQLVKAREEGDDEHVRILERVLKA